MRVAIYSALVLLATATALWKGRTGEKWMGTVVLAGNLLTLLFIMVDAPSFASVPAIFMLLDAALAVLLCVVAVKFPSWVTIAVAAFQINGTLGHLVKLLAPDTIPYSYSFLLRFWAWPMVFAMLLSRPIPQLNATLRRRDWPPLVRSRSA